MDERQRRDPRAQPCARCVVLLALVALFYVISIVRHERRLASCDPPRTGATTAQRSYCSLAVVAGMVGLSFASVPLYRLFCRGDRVWRYDAAGRGGSNQCRCRACHGAFRCSGRARPRLGIPPAEKREIRVHPGAQSEVYFRAVNRTAAPVTAQAIYNVTPTKAGIYFDKLQCFCFMQSDLAARVRASIWASRSLSIPTC